MAKTHGIDGRELIFELAAKGVSLDDISARLKVSPGAHYRWLDGSEPLHSNGEALLILHAEVCPNMSKSVRSSPQIHHGESAAAQPTRAKTSTTDGDDDGQAKRQQQRKGTR